MYHRLMQIRQGSSQKASERLGIEIASMTVFGVGFFALCALLTYVPSDPSPFSNSHAAVANTCGRVVAFFSSILLAGFGIGAFLIPVALIFIAVTIHKREGWTRMVGLLGGMTLATLALTVFLSLQWKYWPYSSSLLLTGGTIGVWFSDLLVKQFNAVGSSIVSLLVFFLALALSVPVSIARLGARGLSFVLTLIWQATKVLVTYFAYLVGLLAVRLVRAMGDLLQRAFDYAIQKAKERKQTRAIKIGGVGTEKAGEKTGEKASENKTYLMPSELPPFEVPNALPELEGARESSQGSAVVPSLSGKTPEILPPTALGVSAGGGDEAAQRAAAKLARAARAKRGIWRLPPLEFIRKPPKVESSIDREKLLQNSQTLVRKFADFGIDGEVTAVRPGPVITLYEFKPGPGIKVSRISALADDLSMALSAQSVRILAPLPGKSVVGIEIPSEARETVYLREFLQHPDFYGQKHIIPIAMGKDIGGQPYLSDLVRMPHLLCAGQTGSGKSVFMNGLICSLFYRFTPDELRMILVDPKFIEFRAYQDMPHLLLPVVDDPKQASTALKWAVREMDRRYRILSMVGARNLSVFNQKVEEMGCEVISDLLLSEENQPEGMTQLVGSDWLEAFEPDETGVPKVGKLPYIVVIIDELADLMMVARKEVEISIARLAQKARAAGIHLVVATQRPSTDVITGLIKANLPSRVSFQLAAYADSKTILDRAGAERLLGQGDMLFVPPGMSQLVRLHGAFLEDEEIAKVTAFLKSQGKPAYRDEILIEEDDEDALDDDASSDDALFQEAVELVKHSGHASASFLQRHLKVGYNRAARMIETMESRGIVGPADGARPREVLMR